MRRVVDSAILTDTIPVFRIGILPACIEFLQRNFVRRITVDFVGAHMAEDSIARKATRGFEHVHRTASVDVEVEIRNLFGFVVRRLSGAVDH